MEHEENTDSAAVIISKTQGTVCMYEYEIREENKMKVATWGG